MPGKSPGPSIKNPKVYEALKKKGYSKEKAARISNAMDDDDVDAIADGALIEWLLDKGSKPCPRCKGEGELSNGKECPTCKGEGVVSLQDRKRDRDDDDDDADDCGPGGVHAMRKRMKRGSDSVTFTDAAIVDKLERDTKNGFLVAHARVARTGIQLYGGDEIGVPNMNVVRVYRPPEEVFSKDAMRSLAHMPVTLDHPPVMVDKENWDEYAVGHTADEVSRDGDCIRVPMMVCDGKAIAAIKERGARELSVGYTTDLKWGKGTTPDGEEYDAIQTAIRGNHLAVVPAARGGSRLRIGDDHEGEPVMTVKILVDGQSVQFADERDAQHVEKTIKALSTQIEDTEKKLSAAAAAKEQEEEKVRRHETDSKTKDGEIVALKKQLEDAQKAAGNGEQRAKEIKDRIHLLLTANAAMDGKLNLDECLSKSDAEIHRVVVAAQLGDETAKTLDDPQVAGAFRALTAKIKIDSGTGVTRLADNLSMLSFGGGGTPGDPRGAKDKAYGDYVNSITNAWKRPADAGNGR